jgi:hypothetical protein
MLYNIKNLIKDDLPDLFDDFLALSSNEIS